MGKKGFFICFTGIDGSGKSTIVNMLVSTLNEKGVPVKYRYNRYVPLLLKPALTLGKLLFFRKEDFFSDYSGYSKAKKKTSKRHPVLATAYRSLLIFDYALQTLVRIKIPVYFGQNIVCDRYIYDTIITDFSVDFNFTDEEIRSSLHSFDFFPRPDRVFLVDVPEEIAFSRKDDVPSVDYLRDRRASYHILASECGMDLIDGSLPLERIRLEVESIARGVANV
ncbi:dTMP kinase [Methanofollis fontis]|uniref:Thymidylate kinase n=1 Tax=Methanofollis fontis TaxID=2052832 RepID=A0A483CVN7_9EURY|nr:hypothetical protein [Methanofollis fontis]TAJ45180.1 hypothetical protein CUJ86_00030 [Methanofollis fontis]